MKSCIYLFGLHFIFVGAFEIVKAYLSTEKIELTGKKEGKSKRIGKSNKKHDSKTISKTKH